VEGARDWQRYMELKPHKSECQVLHSLLVTQPQHNANAHGWCPAPSCGIMGWFLEDRGWWKVENKWGNNGNGQVQACTTTPPPPLQLMAPTPQSGFPTLYSPCYLNINSPHDLFAIGHGLVYVFSPTSPLPCAPSNVWPTPSIGFF